MYVRTFTLDEKRERVRNCQGIQENDCAKKFCCNSDSCNWPSDISMISMLLRLEPEKNLGKLHPSKQTNTRIQSVLPGWRFCRQNLLILANWSSFWL